MSSFCLTRIPKIKFLSGLPLGVCCERLRTQLLKTLKSTTLIQNTIRAFMLSDTFGLEFLCMNSNSQRNPAVIRKECGKWKRMEGNNHRIFRTGKDH